MICIGSHLPGNSEGHAFILRIIADLYAMKALLLYLLRLIRLQNHHLQAPGERNHGERSVLFLAVCLQRQVDGTDGLLKDLTWALQTI